MGLAMELDFNSTHPNTLLSIVTALERCIQQEHAINEALWTPERIAKLQAVARDLDELWNDLSFDDMRRRLTLPAA